MSFDDVGRFTIAAGRALEREGQRRFKSRGLTVSDVAPLLTLAEFGALTPTELLNSSVLLTSAPVVSHSLNRLESAGLIRRRTNDEDGRSVVVEITERGRRYEFDLADQVLDIQSSFFAPLTAEEQSVLVELMKRCLVHHLGTPPDDRALQ